MAFERVQDLPEPVLLGTAVNEGCFLRGMVRASFVGMRRMASKALLPLALLSLLTAARAEALTPPCARSTCMHGGQPCTSTTGSCTATHGCCAVKTAKVGILPRGEGPAADSQAVLPVSSLEIASMPVAESVRAESSPVKRIPLFLWIRALLI